MSDDDSIYFPGHAPLPDDFRMRNVYVIQGNQHVATFPKERSAADYLTCYWFDQMLLATWGEYDMAIAAEFMNRVL